MMTQRSRYSQGAINSAAAASSKLITGTYNRVLHLFSSKMCAITGAIVLIVATTLLVSFYQKKTNAFCKSNKKLHGKTVLVSGGTSGMGLEMAKDFAKRGAKVIIACPFDKEGEHAKEIIIHESGNIKVVFKNLDLASFESVRAFATDILNSEDKLDILVNNAGVGVGLGEVKRSDDGLDSVMQINYYGHFLLTILLLPILKKSPSRIVNMSSILHRVGKIRIKYMNDSKHWFNFQIYGNSKLCLIHFARELTRRLEGANVTVNCVDPGGVGTGIWGAVAGPTVGHIVSFFFGFVFKTALEGAQTAIHVALDDSLDDISGGLFKNCRQITAASWAYNEKNAKLLWDDSVKVCKLTDEELERCLK